MELTIVLIQINIHMIVMLYSVINCYLRLRLTCAARWVEFRPFVGTFQNQNTFIDGNSVHNSAQLKMNKNKM